MPISSKASDIFGLLEFAEQLEKRREGTLHICVQVLFILYISGPNLCSAWKRLLPVKLISQVPRRSRKMKEISSKGMRSWIRWAIQLC